MNSGADQGFLSKDKSVVLFTEDTKCDIYKVQGSRDLWGKKGRSPHTNAPSLFLHTPLQTLIVFAPHALRHSAALRQSRPGNRNNSRGIYIQEKTVRNKLALCTI